jgi:hypothetical protein
MQHKHNFQALIIIVIFFKQNKEITVHLFSNYFV